MAMMNDEFECTYHTGDLQSTDGFVIFCQPWLLMQCIGDWNQIAQ